MKKFYIGLLLVLLILLSSYLYLQKSQVPQSLETQIANQLPKWIPNVKWSKFTPASEQTGYGVIKGFESTTTMTTKEATVPSFENSEYLKTLGFISDINLSADGPGSSIWGYKKEIKGKTQYIIFSYQTSPTSTKSDEPLQFNCPCQTKITTFISN